MPYLPVKTTGKRQQSHLGGLPEQPLNLPIMPRLPALLQALLNRLPKLPPAHAHHPLPHQTRPVAHRQPLNGLIQRHDPPRHPPNHPITTPYLLPPHPVPRPPHHPPRLVNPRPQLLVFPLARRQLLFCVTVCGGFAGVAAHHAQSHVGG